MDFRNYGSFLHNNPCAFRSGLSDLIFIRTLHFVRNLQFTQNQKRTGKYHILLYSTTVDNSKADFLTCQCSTVSSCRLTSAMQSDKIPFLVCLYTVPTDCVFFCNFLVRSSPRYVFDLSLAGVLVHFKCDQSIEKLVYI